MILIYLFFICARLELFSDFLQFDWLHERAAFYDILARGPKELFFKTNHRQSKEWMETQAKALMTSVIRPDTLYFGTL